jgi:hypothetical protein
MKRYFDRDGNYLGFKDSEGRYFDNTGEYVGFKDSEGRIFDRKGELRIRSEDNERRSRDLLPRAQAEARMGAPAGARDAQRPNGKQTLLCPPPIPAA